MKVYTIKHLIDGYKVRDDLKGKIIVACRNDKGYTHIRHENRLMVLPESPIVTMAFQDNYGRGHYFLNYYEWKPLENKSLWLVSDMKKMWKKTEKSINSCTG